MRKKLGESSKKRIDYYPFGMPMPNRNVEGDYRYGYQGEFAEKEPEIEGTNSFELRMWDYRIGRWTTVDPKSFHHSPYLGMGNNPIRSTDPDGGSPCPPDCGEGGAPGASQTTQTSTYGGDLPIGTIPLDEVVVNATIAGAPVLVPYTPMTPIPGGSPAPRPGVNPLGVFGFAAAISSLAVGDSPSQDPYVDPFDPNDEDNSSIYLYRSMKMGADGYPVTGESSSKLGVRTQYTPNVQTADVYIDHNGKVGPTKRGSRTPHGMSTTLNPNNLAGRRNPVFKIKVGNLTPGLLAFPDSPNGHVTVAPSFYMEYTEYTVLLYSTRLHWEIHK